MAKSTAIRHRVERDPVRAGPGQSSNCADSFLQRRYPQRHARLSFLLVQGYEIANQQARILLSAENAAHITRLGMEIACPFVPENDFMIQSNVYRFMRGFVNAGHNTQNGLSPKASRISHGSPNAARTRSPTWMKFSDSVTWTSTASLASTQKEIQSHW